MPTLLKVFGFPFVTNCSDGDFTYLLKCQWIQVYPIWRQR